MHEDWEIDVYEDVLNLNHNTKELNCSNISTVSEMEGIKRTNIFDTTRLDLVVNP